MEGSRGKVKAHKPERSFLCVTAERSTLCVTSKRTFSWVAAERTFSCVAAERTFSWVAVRRPTERFVDMEVSRKMRFELQGESRGRRDALLNVGNVAE